MKYSQRILKTTELLENGNIMADIGCDHGYMCILAIESHKFSKAYACDVAEGPLSRAKRNILDHKLGEIIIPILSNGFDKLPSDIDCCVICGMGGLLIQNILQNRQPSSVQMKQMILGPHSEVAELRRYLIKETDYGILRETSVADSGKHYNLLDVRPVHSIQEKIRNAYDDPVSLEFGTPVNQTDPGSYLEYLLHEEKKLLEALNKVSSGKSIRAFEKKAEIEEKLTFLKQLIKRTEETDPWVYIPTMNIHS